MKEKAIGQALLEQSEKVLDAIEGKISSDEVTKDFNYQDHSDFSTRLNKMITPKTNTVKTKKK